MLKNHSLILGDQSMKTVLFSHNIIQTEEKEFCFSGREAAGS